MSFHFLKTSLFLSCVALMATGPVEAVKYCNGTIVEEDPEVGGGEGTVSLERVTKPSTVKAYERLKRLAERYTSYERDWEMPRPDGIVDNLNEAVGKGPQWKHIRSQQLAPRPQDVSDVPPFDPRRKVRRWGLIPLPQNEEESKFSQVKVYDYNPNCDLLEKWPEVLASMPYSEAAYRLRRPTDKQRVMDAAFKSLKEELARIMEDRAKIMKMVKVECRWCRLSSDTEEGLISKMKTTLQPEQIYEIRTREGEWDHAKGGYKLVYEAVVRNRPDLLKTMYPDPGIFQYAGTGGSFRRNNNLCEIGVMTQDAGRCLPSSPGGNYRRGDYFKAADEFTADPGRSLLFQVANAHDHFKYGRLLSSPYKSKKDRRVNVGHGAPFIVTQPAIGNSYDKIRAEVRERETKNHMTNFKASLEAISRELPPLKITSPDPGQRAPAGSSGNYRRGYQDNVAPHISRHRIGTNDLSLIFPLEFDESGRHFKGYNKFHSTCREPMMSCADPGQLQGVGDKGRHFRRGYHDNVASSFADDPGRLKSIGDAPTAHFSRPLITVADLNAVIAHFKHVELIGE